MGRKPRKRREVIAKTYDYGRTVQSAAWGAVIGGVTSYCLYRCHVEREKEFPFNSDKYLRRTLAAEHLTNDPVYFQRVLSKRELVMKWAAKQFGSYLAAPPEYGGSLFKGTAINAEYDCDIIIPFKKDSYSTLKDMHTDVFESALRQFGKHCSVVKSTRAIEIVFGLGDEEIYVDIVPGREIGTYAKDKKLNLYVAPEWFWQSGSSFKANIRRQKTLVSNRPGIKRIIKLLKIYRHRNNVDLPTLIIEQGVLEALSVRQYGMHVSETENLLNSMEFIAEKLQQRTLRDVANSNNNLNEKLEKVVRECTANQLLDDIEKIEANPRYLKEIF